MCKRKDLGALIAVELNGAEKYKFGMMWAMIISQKKGAKKHP